MKTLVIENDSKLNPQIVKYLKTIEETPTIITSVNDLSSDEMMSLFKEHELLIYRPTLINHSQHNLLMMMMFGLMRKNELGIKEIHILYNDAESLMEGLREVWKHKRTYLDQVLLNVKIFYLEYNYVAYDKILLEL